MSTIGKDSIILPERETKEARITANSLFENARKRITIIEQQGAGQKKTIIQSLAQDLEGRMNIRTICDEITIQLRGLVSGRFIRECLDVKYKQPHRVSNARRQKKSTSLNLAAVPPLDVNNKGDAQTMTVLGDSSADESSSETPLDRRDIRLKTRKPGVNNELGPLGLGNYLSYWREMGIIPNTECKACQKLSIRLAEMEDLAHNLISNSLTTGRNMTFHVTKEQGVRITNAILTCKERCDLYFDECRMLREVVPDDANI